jgi:8-oxo-dGTP pyrophosphatase MutT (NUDIX family)
MEDVQRVGDAVSLFVSNNPFPVLDIENAEYLVIKRPPNDEWKPGYFSPVTGKVEERDLESLKTFPKPWTEEKLYIETGKREFNEEIKRLEASLLSFRYIGKYYDKETEYNVAVLSGGIYASVDSKNIVVPKLGNSPEAPEIHWMNVKEIKKLARKNKFAGKKSLELLVRDLKKFI